MDNKAFRLDINGLRAWAVVSVVLFHFELPWFSGGFAGVDVFFVISGLLMTGIIVSALESSSFSLWDFYASRARRILPALLVLCLALVGLGWFFLTTIDYVPLGRQAASAVTFLSNIFFWLESGYFDSSSKEKWLLHTWSLSVEWQFYILFPILLIIVGKLWGYRGIKLSLVVVFLGSLVLSILASMSWTLRPAGYFLLPTRAWEMVAGGAIWWLSVREGWRPKYPNAFEMTGLVLIVVSTLIFTAKSNWPSYNALVPVVGAMLVLIAQRQSSVYTGHPLAQWLGDRSYSLYLWHWPIVVLLVFIGKKSEPLYIFSGIVLSLLCAELSYRLVEIPARNWLRRLKVTKELYWISCTTFILFCLGIGASQIRFDGRVPADIEIIANEAANFHPARERCIVGGSETDSPSCVYGGPKLAAIVVGDSHAEAVISAVQAALPSENEGVIGWMFTACPTMLNAHQRGTACHEFNQWISKQLEDIPSEVPLIMINSLANTLKQKRVYFSGENNSWTEQTYLSKFKREVIETACHYAKTRGVYLVRPIPSMLIDVPKELSRARMFGIPASEASISMLSYLDESKEIWAAQDIAAEECDVMVLDATKYLCDDKRCYGSFEGRPLYIDSSHLSEYGNRLLVPMFDQVFVGG